MSSSRWSTHQATLPPPPKPLQPREPLRQRRPRRRSTTYGNRRRANRTSSCSSACRALVRRRVAQRFVLGDADLAMRAEPRAVLHSSRFTTSAKVSRPASSAPTPSAPVHSISSNRMRPRPVSPFSEATPRRTRWPSRSRASKSSGRSASRSSLSTPAGDTGPSGAILGRQDLTLTLPSDRQESELFEEMKQISKGVDPNLTIMVLDGAIGTWPLFPPGQFEAAW